MFRFSFLIALAGLSPWSAFAHKVTTVSVVTDVDTKQQTYEVNLVMGIESSGDAAIDDSISPTEAAETFTKETLIVYFDKTEVKEHRITTEIITTSDEDTPEELRRTKANIVLSGKIPEGSKDFLLYVDENTEASVVMVFRKDGIAGRRPQVMYPGDFSRPNSVLATGMKVPSKGTKGAQTNQIPSGPDEVVADEATFFDSIKKGINTVFPNGLIHWLFALGFLLLTLHMRPITIQVAAFIIAHSLGLAVAALEIATAPESIALVVMGLGLFYVGFENLFVTSLKPWRPVIIFVVGVFHGFAFANVYAGDDVSNLIGFNLGIEIALIAVLMIGLIVLNILMKQEWYRKVIVIPASVLLALSGLYWACLPLFEKG